MGLEKLTLDQEQIFTHLEQSRPRVVGQLTAPCEVGKALRAIRDKRLHREVSDNFYDYCLVRFGMVPERVDALIGMADHPEGVAPVPPARPKEPEPVIYFIEAGDLIKIGFTTDIKKRMAALRATSPVALVLLGLMSGGSKEERELHRRFVTSRQHGEWFHRSAEFVRFIKEDTQHD